MENRIRTSYRMFRVTYYEHPMNREYTVEIYEFVDGVYELSIYDNSGHSYDPREFMEYTSGVNSVKFNPVDGYWAVNLTKDDVNTFFDAIIKHNKANQRR